MFYNHLIFSMVTLSLRIVLKYCVFPGGTPCFTWGNKEFHQTGSFVPLKNEEDKEYSFREPDDKR
jgi:hypothetical protein